MDYYIVRRPAIENQFVHKHVYSMHCFTVSFSIFQLNHQRWSQSCQTTKCTVMQTDFTLMWRAPRTKGEENKYANTLDVCLMSLSVLNCNKIDDWVIYYCAVSTFKMGTKNSRETQWNKGNISIIISVLLSFLSSFLSAYLWSIENSLYVYSGCWEFRINSKRPRRTKPTRKEVRKRARSK